MYVQLKNFIQIGPQLFSYLLKFCTLRHAYKCFPPGTSRWIGSCVNKKAQLSLTNTADASASVARFI